MAPVAAVQAMAVKVRGQPSRDRTKGGYGAGKEAAASRQHATHIHTTPIINDCQACRQEARGQASNTYYNWGAVSMSLQIRAAKHEDAEICGRICYEAFKVISEHHNFPPDFPAPEVGVGLLSMMISRDDIFGVVAELEGRAIGSNFLWEQSMIAGVGPITVDPTVQNRAVGRELMTAVLERAEQRGVAGVRLVQAAYHSRSMSLYAKLGFDIREPLALMQGPALGLEIPGYAVRPATAADQAQCDALCFRVHGHDRSLELQGAIAQATAMVVEFAGRIVGYTTGIGFFGHTVAESNEGLKALIAAAGEFSGPGFLLPTRNSELFRWCLAHGLRTIQPMTLMSHGLYNEPAGAFLPSILF